MIFQIREWKKRLKAPDISGEDKKLLETSISKMKKRLPGFLFQCSDFQLSETKSGRVGKWRKQDKAILNGLFVIDFDHVENPREVFFDWETKVDLEAHGVLLVFITPSGEGLKVVAKASSKVGDLADNARNLACILGLPLDEACKDASRLSFTCGKEDILLIDKTIFNYDNQEYETDFGEYYRNGGSNNNRCCSTPSANPTGDSVDSSRAANERAANSDKTIQLGEITRIVETKGLKVDDNGNLLYGEIPYVDIIKQYTEINGAPVRGSRHTWLLSFCQNFRYICDFDVEVLYYVTGLSSAGQEIISEGGKDEVYNICKSAVSFRESDKIPTAIQGIISDLTSSNHDGSPKSDSIDYAYWWRRLKPFLKDTNNGYTQAVCDIPDELKLGGILSCGAMFGTYLTKMWWKHYDGHPYRLSYIVYIIGDAASGKSFLIRQDQHIMRVLREQDNAGREWERQAKEDKQRRATSSKEAKKEAMAIMHPVIRYIPSTISNAKFYQRSQDAVAVVNGENMHLHLYTMESELATALRAQVGSWAGKIDLELKSFQNEYAGVDYANEQSVNGLIQVNWNQVISGTQEALSRKLKQSNITDGYVTRLALWVMPESKFQMLEKTSTPKQIYGAELEQWALKLQDLQGEIKIPKLVDFCYEWCNKQCKLAFMENDYVRDYFRKRIPLYMIRYSIPRIIMREYDNFIKNGKINIKKEDLDFAELIGDYLIWIQMYYFGIALKEAKEQESRVQRMTKMNRIEDFFNSLPEKFKLSDINPDSTTRTRLQRLTEQGYLENISRGEYKKTKKSFA